MTAITHKEMLELPLKAIAAYAARCARKVQPLYSIPEPVYSNVRPKVKRQDAKYNAQVVDEAVRFAERIASSSRRDNTTLPDGIDDVVDVSERIRRFGIKESRRFAAQDHTPGPNDTCIWFDRGLEEHAQYVLKSANAARACSAAKHARLCGLAAARRDKAAAAKAAVQAAEAAAHVDQEARGEAHYNFRDFDGFEDATVRNEFEMLAAAVLREGWTDETPVDPEFFSPDSPIERRVMLAINDLCVALCRLIAQDGRTLRQIEWRLLERTIATALRGLGFDVTLTPEAKDGGKDVIARCCLRGKRLTYYVEIKHWRSQKLVGSSAISHFVEVNLQDQTDGGLLLSSSGFAPTVLSQLAEITTRRIRLGSDVKIVSLCQHFVQKQSQAIWHPRDVLPEILFSDTISRR